ncbi:LPS export ABC transporter periplasmic protein LptC [Amaricoccus tamworthensis]|uniref:LPS export ABC transporter periplasmic protein LptC n=1 Tax=Amaricoccus tamworthensis TaxID=57002 RepID=UPI003C7A2F69
MAEGPDLYSRFVAISKIVLPLTAIALLAGLFLIKSDDDFGGEITFSQSDLEQFGKGLRISNPVFSGFTKSRDAFQFTADLVVPDAAPPQHAEITSLSGKIDYVNGRTITVESNSANLDIPGQMLDLNGDVSLGTSDGYGVSAPRLSLNLGNGTLKGDERVQTKGPVGQIDSGSLEIRPSSSDSQSRIFSFGKGVRLVYDPTATN